MTNTITQNAIRALLYEVVTNPKPGLVDPHSQGPHTDMNIYTFIDSSLSLTNYFKQAVIIGQTYSNSDLTQMFSLLRKEGVQAEKSMYTATHGVNTHKGAIFALGIFVCAESYRKQHQTDLFITIKKMCSGLVEHDLGQNKAAATAGASEYRQYGYTGARGEAEQGYPLIEHISLPFLKSRPGSLQTRLLDTLMKIATVTIDSNLIKRAGTDKIISWLRKEAESYLALGGYATDAGKEKLAKLDAYMTKMNYSLGGCADLLIVTIFVALEQNYL
ncbi:triphosphoribosyl-dephospho-CoA synthase CitG [Lactobacillus sp. ESL0791]|nr:triphosphoribosyl-dephospho-CoA synthase CitG [Lactobacillus sp. ESL0791]MDF7637890.1 triphosphoribosyl-dephospho-CoA synthase CitG [Lactobacillus sp. ESL0791]